MVRRFPFGEQIASQHTVVNNLKNLPGHIEFILFPKLKNANRGNRKGLRQSQGSNMLPFHQVGRQAVW